jgi:hypothetical protein
MLLDVIGARGVVFYCVMNAEKDEQGYAELSFHDIFDKIGCLQLARVKLTLKLLLTAGVLECVRRGPPKKNKWRVSSDALKLISDLVV